LLSLTKIEISVLLCLNLLDFWGYYRKL